MVSPIDGNGKGYVYRRNMPLPNSSDVDELKGGIKDLEETTSPEESTTEKLGTQRSVELSYRDYKELLGLKISIDPLTNLTNTCFSINSSIKNLSPSDKLSIATDPSVQKRLGPEITMRLLTLEMPYPKKLNTSTSSYLEENNFAGMANDLVDYYVDIA